MPLGEFIPAPAAPAPGVWVSLGVVPVIEEPLAPVPMVPFIPPIVPEPAFIPPEPLWV
jgi:hypothetical protein